jgi:sodium/glucose cotransporter 1
MGRKVYNWLCGIDDRPKPKLTPEEKELIKKKMTSLKENPMARKVTAAVALVTAIITTFLLGFFG